MGRMKSRSIKREQTLLQVAKAAHDKREAEKAHQLQRDLKAAYYARQST